MKPHLCTIILFLLSVISECLLVADSRAEDTAFSYQGRLTDNGSLANGSYDLTFTLYDVENGGSAIAGPVTNNAVGVTNGLFTVTLDFGDDVCDGNPRWLEIGVCTNGADTFTTLCPRQAMLPVPHSVFADTASNLSGNLAATQLTGTMPLDTLPGALTNLASGNGGGLTNISSSAVVGLGSAAFQDTSFFDLAGAGAAAATAATNGYPWSSLYQAALGFTPLTPQQTTNAAAIAAQRVAATNNTFTPSGGALTNNGNLVVNGNVTNNGDTWFAWNGEPAGSIRIPHFQAADGAFVLGTYINLIGNGIAEGQIGRANPLSDMMTIACDVPQGIVGIGGYNGAITWYHQLGEGGYTNSTFPKGDVGFQIFPNGRMTLRQTGAYWQGWPWKTPIFQLQYNSYGYTGGPWYTNNWSLGMTNNQFFIGMMNMNSNLMAKPLTINCDNGSFHVSSVNLMNNALSVSTNGTTISNVILNPVATPPVVTGNQGALWNSNQYLYWVTSAHPDGVLLSSP